MGLENKTRIPSCGPKQHGLLPYAEPSRAPSANGGSRRCVCLWGRYPNSLLSNVLCFCPSPAVSFLSLRGRSSLTLQCNKLQPCSHCKRRFPEPICEYRPLPAASSTKKVAFGSPRKLPAFHVSLPAGTPKAFHYRKRVRPLAHESQRAQTAVNHEGEITATSSRLTPLVIDHQAQAALEDQDEDREDVERVDASGKASRVPADNHSQGLVHTKASGQPTLTTPRQNRNTASVVSYAPSPWLLAGPLDAMSSLPIAVSKQRAMLIHNCEFSIFHLWCHHPLTNDVSW